MSHLIINARVLISLLPAEQGRSEPRSVLWHPEGSGALLTTSLATSPLRWHLPLPQLPVLSAAVPEPPEDPSTEIPSAAIPAPASCQPQHCCASLAPLPCAHGSSCQHFSVPPIPNKAQRQSGVSPAQEFPGKTTPCCPSSSPALLGDAKGDTRTRKALLGSHPTLPMFSSSHSLSHCTVISSPRRRDGLHTLAGKELSPPEQG